LSSDSSPLCIESAKAWENKPFNKEHLTTQIFDEVGCMCKVSTKVAKLAQAVLKK
jgi:hypothetical protein